MAPTPAPTPTPETMPTLDATLVSKTIVPSVTNLYLGPNTLIKNTDNGGVQTTLPIVTSNAIYCNDLNILPGSTSSYILKADNLNIDINGNLTKVGTITSTGNSSFTGSVSAGSLSTTGSLLANSVTSTNGFTTTSGDFTTTNGTVSTKELQVSGTNLSVDSLVGTLNLKGTLTSTNVSIGNQTSVFQIDSSTGTLKTQGTITAAGNISTTGSAAITAAGALNGASLNISSNAFKVDNLGALTATNYSIDKDGNVTNNGNLNTKGSVKIANEKFIIDIDGNISKSGTINSKSIGVTGSLTTTEGINIGSNNTIVLSNNGSSYFTNSVNLGATPASGSSYPIMLNATDGKASFASNKAIINSDGSLSLLNGAMLLNSDGVKLGVNSTNGTTTNKIELNSSSGNAIFAGTASFANNNIILTSNGSATFADSITANGKLNILGLTTLSNGLNVTGASGLNGTATISGLLSANGGISVATNKFNVDISGNTNVAGTLSVAGAVTANSTLSVTGAVTTNSTLNVTGAATLSDSLAVTRDLSVNTNKFIVNAATGNTTVGGNLRVTSDAYFSNSQIQLKDDGSVYAKNYLKTDFAVTNYTPNDASNDTTTIIPANGVFNSTTNKYLTTQEYVDKAIFKQATRLNLITKDMDVQLANFNNFSKILAAMEGADGMNPLTTLNGIIDNVEDVKVSISDLLSGGYNSILVNCVPSIWGDGAAPELIPTPISNLYKEDGWFYGNMSLQSKINWYLPSYSGMKIKDITNLFMNNFLLSTTKIPKITIFTAPKNDSTDTVPGVFNAKIEYYFFDPTPTSVTAKKSCLYLIKSPKNSYSDKSNDFKCTYSITSNGSNLPVQTTFNTSTTFSNSFDTTIVKGEDNILTFAIETRESSIKDYMFILQNFNITTQNGTTQMLFQNSSVANDYLFKYFFKQHTDFSDVSLDSNNVVDKDNYNGYVSGILGNSIYPTSSVKAVSPESHIVNTTLKLNGIPITYDNQILLFESNITSVPLTCNLENKNDKVKIVTGLNTLVDAQGDYTGNVMLVSGDNFFTLTVTDQANDHSKQARFCAHVKSNDARLNAVSINSTPITLTAGTIPSNTKKTVPAGTTSVNVSVTTKSSLATFQVIGNTNLSTGDNTVTVKVVAEDSTVSNNTFVVHVLSDDTSLTTFTVNGGTVSNGSMVSLNAGTTSVSVVAVPTAQSSGAFTSISGVSGLVEGDNTLAVTVTAESGTVKTYNVTLHVLNNNSGLASITINGTSVDLGVSQFTFLSTTTSVNVVATPVSSKSSVEITGTTSNLQVGSNVMNVKVTTEQGTQRTYSYTLYKQSGDTILTSVYIGNQSLNFVNDQATITLSNYTPVSSIALTTTAHDSKSVLTYTLNSLPVTLSLGTINGLVYGTNILTITDTAEDVNVQKTYTVTINNFTNNPDLSHLTATYSDYPVVDLLSNTSVFLGNGLGASVDVTILAEPVDSHSSVTIDGVVGLNKTITVTNGSSRSVAVVVTGGDGTTLRTYNVSFSLPSSGSSDNSLSKFSYATSDSVYNLGYNDTIVDLDENDLTIHTITINRNTQGVIYFTVIPNDITTASIKYTIPVQDRSEVITLAANSLPADTLPEDYYGFGYFAKYGWSNTITVEITAQNGNVNTYHININMPTLSTAAPYLTSTSYLNYVNTNGIGSDNYYVDEAITFGTNNNLYMVTLVSKTTMDLYNRTENGTYAFTYNDNDVIKHYKNRDVICLIYNGSNWKHSSYKSNTIKYPIAVLYLSSSIENKYVTLSYKPVYSNDNSIIFTGLSCSNYLEQKSQYGVLSGNIDFKTYNSGQSYTLFIQNFNDSIFQRFSVTLANQEYVPFDNTLSNFLGYDTSYQYKKVQFINNINLNNRVNSVYYLKEELYGRKLHIIALLNYKDNYRAVYNLLRAYDTNGTTILNIDNIDFANVVLNGTTLEFTTSTGDKFVNKNTDWSPITSVNNNTYYDIKKVVPPN
uniref:Cadherin-like beta-sandwich-like domain-containing protein n=1 Tax=viral metagenome TaxID=1070528 RepID=A0A6C0DHR9_9ZZZZ